MKVKVTYKCGHKKTLYDANSVAEAKRFAKNRKCFNCSRKKK